MFGTARRMSTRGSGLRLVHGSVAAALVVSAVLVAGACSNSDPGSDEAASTTESSTSSTPSTESTTTTGVQRPEADRAAKDLAAAGVLQVADFGDGWSEVREAMPAELTVADESSWICGNVEGGPRDRLGNGAIVDGPVVQFGEQPGYAYSRTYAYPTEADAIAALEVNESDEWTNCLVEELQTFQDDNNDLDVTVRLETRDNESLGEGGFEAYALLVGEDADGEAVLLQAKSVYRVGRVVILVTQEDGGLGDDTDAFYDGTSNALFAAYDRIDALG